LRYTPTSRTRAADFYQGRTLTLIVGFAPGGGVDSNARLISRHLARFIAGQPNIVVQNIERGGRCGRGNQVQSARPSRTG